MLTEAAEVGLIREALNVGPEDQSLWYYHQFLMLNLFEPVGRVTIVPSFTLEDRVTYVTRELEAMAELLEDYDDVKWIYEALMESTTALANMEDRQLREEEREDLRLWLGRLKTLDPMRSGRWVEIERSQGLLAL
jgi:geranylgeranyl transferase type-2 subunit alpha